ncbi:MAG: GNAT family N-acetyltransferase [Candidatus Nomurabacteria bacterium]|nr:MAG: GNAT family N-acetyltransferase [Candidatus Nomurabacteria bacterium]
MISVERLRAYTPEDAAGIGRLMPFLSESFLSTPIPEERLRAIIESDYHDQLVAREDTRRIVGAATLSLILGAGAGGKAHLEDFVTDPETKGVGSALWKEMGAWCVERDVELHFTSRSSRIAAQHFYLNRGAEIRDTNVFKKNFRED